jgi:hypothetical protein
MSMISTQASPLPGVPIVESPFFDVLSQSFAGDADLLRIAQDLRRDEFAVFDFPDAVFDAHAAALKKDLDRHYDWPQWLLPGGGMRIHDAWKFHPGSHALVTNARVLEEKP